jgi:hypothetical protein
MPKSFSAKRADDNILSFVLGINSGAWSTTVEVRSRCKFRNISTSGLNERRKIENGLMLRQVIKGIQYMD